MPYIRARPCTRTDVVVVGAGPAGLLLTALLTRTGAAVTLVEREHDPARAQQGVTLQPLTRELLAALGFGLAWEPTDVPVVALEEHGPDGMLFRAEYSELDGAAVPCASNTRQAAVRGGLLRSVAGRADVRTGQVVVAVESAEPGSCRLLMRSVDADPGQPPDTVESACVVVCDGADSVTRDLLGIPASVTPFAHRMHLLRFPGHGPDGVVMRYARRPEGLAVTVPGALPGWTHAYCRLADPEVPAGDVAGRFARISGHVTPDLARAARETPPQVVLLAPKLVVAERWRSGGAVLLGDSAHAMHYLAAQGMNVSLQNAVLLAASVGRFLDGAPESELDAVERLRRPFITELQDWQRGRLDSVHRYGEPDSWYADRFTEFALADPPSRAALRAAARAIAAAEQSSSTRRPDALIRETEGSL